MDLNRVQRWSRELNDRVEKELGGDQKEDILWLVEHLGEYLQRWLGFASMERLEVKATFANDAFCIVLGAIMVINKHLSEIEDRNWFPLIEWEDLEKGIDFIQGYPIKENLGLVAERFNRLWEALPPQGGK